MTQFEELYRKCFKDVYRYLCVLCGSAELAEELTSETFFKAMAAFESFRGDCEARVWLLRIAKNCYFSHVRKHKRELADFSAQLPAPPQPSAEERIIQKSEAERARRAILALPENYREVFMWRVYGELSFADIAGLFGKSENWACVTYHRARKMLIKRMEDENDE